MQARVAPMNALGWPIQVAVLAATLEKNFRMGAVTTVAREGASVG
jgi:hypothetical protein